MSLLYRDDDEISSYEDSSIYKCSKQMGTYIIGLIYNNQQHTCKNTYPNKLSLQLRQFNKCAEFGKKDMINIKYMTEDYVNYATMNNIEINITISPAYSKTFNVIIY